MSAGRRTILRVAAAVAFGALLGAARVARAADAVSVSLEQFGALRAYRPGDPTGMCVSLRSSLPEPVECIVQWDLPNADGDLVSHTRTITLAPGVPAQCWLYARLRPATAATSVGGEVQTVRVFEAREGERVREIGSERFLPSAAARVSEPVQMTQDLIAIVGDSRMGLETLDAQFDGAEVPAMNEATRVLPKVRPAELPDRWEGLASASTIVWAGPDPGALAADRGTALLSWIEHGGHLVVVLPESGDPWALRAGRGNLLSATLPSKGFRRVDAIEVEGLLPVLAKRNELRNSSATVPATLFDPKTLDRGWRPLVMLPDSAASRELRGTALAVQRLWGHGRISLIGVDMAALHGQALMPEGLPQADVFWNRVLGRRADAPTTADYSAWDTSKPRRLARQSERRIFDAGDAALVLGRIGQTGAATGGVLAVLLFFACYWVLAVPANWMVLKRRGRLARSWVVFAAVAAVAAPVAWAMGLVFGASSVQVRHLTVADWVLPSPDDGEGGRARRLRVNAWMSVALGGFGTTPIAIDTEAPGKDLLLDWSPPPDGDMQRFPDSAQSQRAIDRPEALRAPSRATTTQLQAWSLTPPPAAWGRVAWIEENRPVQAVCTLGSNPRVELRGALRHGLPAPLRNVQIVHVMPWTWAPREWTRNANPEIKPTGLPPRPARMVQKSGDWPSDEPLDLGALLYPQGAVQVAAGGKETLVEATRELFAQPLEGDMQSALGLAFGSATWVRQLAMLGMFEMLPPPAYRQNPPTDPIVIRFRRLLGRELDLSPWFAQPCVIVQGFLDESALPLPLRVDGRAPESAGPVLVRFILPLPEPDRGFVRPSS